jgi:hypothetical protein
VSSPQSSPRPPASGGRPPQPANPGLAASGRASYHLRDLHRHVPGRSGSGPPLVSTPGAADVRLRPRTGLTSPSPPVAADRDASPDLRSRRAAPALLSADRRWSGNRMPAGGPS